MVLKNFATDRHKPDLRKTLKLDLKKRILWKENLYLKKWAWLLDYLREFNALSYDITLSFQKSFLSYIYYHIYMPHIYDGCLLK